MNDRTIFLAIRPRHALAILTGTKTVELRRTPPRIATPTLAYLYASSPTKAVIGSCRITHVEQLRLDELWHRHGAATGISHADFLAYFEGVDEGNALHIEAATPLSTPVSLDHLRERWRGFHPPQSFRYLTPRHLQTLRLAA